MDNSQMPPVPVGLVVCFCVYFETSRADEYETQVSIGLLENQSLQKPSKRCCLDDEIKMCVSYC